MLYKIGDIVRIRDDLKVGSYYGLVPIKMSYDMVDATGTVGKVTEINEDEFAVKVNGWWWSEVMVNDISVAKPSEGRWIPTEQVLPPPDSNVRHLVVCEAKNGYRSINLAWIDDKGTWHGMGSFAKVTHWMPLPPLPYKDAPYLEVQH